MLSSLSYSEDPKQALRDSLVAAILLPGESSFVQIGKISVSRKLVNIFEQAGEGELLKTFRPRQLLVLNTLASFPNIQTEGVPSDLFLEAFIAAARRLDGTVMESEAASGHLNVLIYNLRKSLEGTSLDIPKNASGRHRAIYRLVSREFK